MVLGRAAQALLAHPPPGRRNPLWGHDRVSGRMFVWGGTADGCDPIEGSHVNDLARGQEGWNEVAIEDGPARRGSGGGLPDPARGLSLFGFGNTRTGPLTDLRALELRAD